MLLEIAQRMRRLNVPSGMRAALAQRDDVVEMQIIPTLDLLPTQTADPTVTGKNGVKVNVLNISASL